MKHYFLSVIEPSAGEPPSPDALAAIRRQLDAVRDEMKAAGAWVFAAGLHPPSTATVVRSRDEKVLITDGPFTEAKEHIGGFTIIAAADLDAALAWARKLSRATTLPIEVRPIREHTT